MKEKQHKRIAMGLSILWAVSAVVAYVYSGTKRITEQVSGIHAAASSESPIWPLLIVACYFFPLLLLIKKHAALGNLPKMEHIVKILVLFLSCVLVLAPVAYLLMFVA